MNQIGTTRQDRGVGEGRTTKPFMLAASLCLVIVIALTRGFALTHNLFGHPDEHVFYTSTELLLLDLRGEDEYEPVKAYPEGTYVFRLPFQILAGLVPLDADYGVCVDTWGRISSVFYYTAGALIGLWLVCDPLGGGRAGSVIYVLTAGFGLFQIEQSRYGTFDPISFFVLTLVIALCVLALRRKKQRFLLAAAFAAGVAAAGKYPLFYFALLPLSVPVLQKTRGRRLITTLALMAGCVLLGFLLFSPSVVRSPRFFLSTILGGINGYVKGGNPEGYSTVPESVASVMLYHGLYSDLPFAGLFALSCARRIPCRADASEESRFLGAALPTILLVFLGYNLMLTTFFLRTLFPWFCISMLYACAGLGRLCRGRKVWRFAALALCLAMTARGIALVAMLDGKREARAVSALLEKIQSCGGDTALLGNYAFDYDLRRSLPDSVKVVELMQLYEGNYPELPPDTAILTASLEHGLAKRCLFPPNKEWTRNITFGWERFREENASWQAAKLYPDWIYPLFGFWVHGSTATAYEFPTNWLYFRPAGS